MTVIALESDNNSNLECRKRKKILLLVKELVEELVCVIAGSF